jgi:hypothetical protein
MKHAIGMTHVAVYVDTSGSMSSKMQVLNERNENRSLADKLFADAGNIRRERWEIAMDLWGSIIDHIASMPLTVRTIHSKGESRTLREIGNYSVHELKNTQFPPRNGGTYLWEFLVKEGRGLIEQTDKWMFILISDGMDNESSGQYKGVEGFRKCVEELQKLEIDVEFHIVGLGLPESACDVFRQVSGSTGGVFYNLGNTNEEDEESLQEIVENLVIAIDEAIDPALRARSRRRRQTEYLETCSDGDLELVEIPSAVPNLKFDEERVYSRLGVSELNPDDMGLWETSLLSLAGHSEVQITQEEHWSSSVSHSSDHRLETTIRGIWTLDATDLAQLARGNIDQLFTLQNQIRHSFIPAEQRAIVIRGLSVSEQVINIVKSSGARILILPSDLPYPPINWETTRLFLEAREAPFDEGGWSMLPTGIHKESKYAALYDFFYEVDGETYAALVGTNTSAWTANLGNLPSDLSRYLESSSWETISDVNKQLASSISAQFNGLVNYLSTHFNKDTTVFIVRPDEVLMNTLDKNIALQIELLNRIDDFLTYNANRMNMPMLNVEYWPTLHQA